MTRKLDPLLLAVLIVLAGLVWVSAVQIHLPVGGATRALSADKDSLSVGVAGSAPPATDAVDATESALLAAEDPFWPKPPVPKAEPVLVLAPIVQAPPPPPPITLPFRYFGRMNTPAGREVLMVAVDGETYEAKVGAVLRDEFRVTAIEATRVRFEYLPTSEALELSLPAIPRTTGVSRP